MPKYVYFFPETMILMESLPEFLKTLLGYFEGQYGFLLQIVIIMELSTGRIAKSLICKLKILTYLVLQQLYSHICLVKLIISCRFARAALARRKKGEKQQKRINFCQANVRANLLEDDSNFADKTFCYVADALQCGGDMFMCVTYRCICFFIITN